jgi:predicted nucleic acid-binding protein
LSPPKWGTGSGGSGIIAAENERNARKQAYEVAEQEFVAQYGMSSELYVANAIANAYATTSQAQGFKHRSKAGKGMATAPRWTQAKCTATQEYHDMEEKAKSSAKDGRIVDAIIEYASAAQLRDGYENAHKLSDRAHLAHKTALRQRSESLLDIKNDLDSHDPDVVTARLLVNNFFSARSIVRGI